MTRIGLGGRDGCRKDDGRTSCALLISVCVALWPIGVFSPIRTRRGGISGTGAVCVCFHSPSRRVASDGSNTASVPVTLAPLRRFRGSNALLRSRKASPVHRQRARSSARDHSPSSQVYFATDPHGHRMCLYRAHRAARFHHMTDSTHKRGMAGDLYNGERRHPMRIETDEELRQDEILRTRLSQVHAGDGTREQREKQRRNHDGGVTGRHANKATRTATKDAPKFRPAFTSRALLRWQLRWRRGATAGCSSW
jgi:hypothetical protein